MSIVRTKVLSISTSDDKGGASIAAFRLHCAINIFSEKVKSKLLVARKYRPDKSIISYYPWFFKVLYFLKLYASRKIQLLQKTQNPIAHSGSYFPSMIDRYINKSNCDVIHIHWVQDEFMPISSILKVNKPIIWTLHDSWPFCGSEHHPLDLNDSRYIFGYDIVKRNYFKNNIDNKFFNPDLDKYNWLKKKKLIYKKISFVAPSKWMKSCLENSYLFKNHYCEVIPNPVPEIFYKANKVSKISARKKFNLPVKKPILIYVANRANTDINKGWNKIKDVIFELSKIINFHLLIVGGDCELISSENYSYQKIKRLASPEDLSLIYRSANLLLLPSLIETLPQVATECITTGTPIVAFKGSGTEDVVINNKTGLLVDRFNKKQFLDAIMILLSKSKNNLSSSCYKYSSLNWNEKIIAQKYSSLYKSLSN